MQIYRGMDVLSAKPTAAEMQGIPHHMLGIADPAEKFSAPRYRDMAKRAIADVIARGKRAVLCGEDSCAHIYRSDTRLCAPDGITRASANRPTAVVEVLDPMVLSSRVREACDCPGKEAGSIQVPDPIRRMFDEELTFCSDRRRLYVTLGQFSIVRLERDAQLIGPVLDYSIPTKECCDNPGCTEDPCEMFSRIPFPSAQFTPRGCDQKKEKCDIFQDSSDNA